MPLVTLLRGLPWRAIGVALLAAGLVWAGWTARGWVADAEISGMKERHAAALAEASEAARTREAALSARMAAIDTMATDQRRKDDDEIRRRRAAVDAGAVRLRVAARCLAAPSVPPAAAGAGLDPGARAELDPGSRPDYFALRSGMTRLEQKLAACQNVLAADREDGR